MPKYFTPIIVKSDFTSIDLSVAGKRQFRDVSVDGVIFPRYPGDVVGESRQGVVRDDSGLGAVGTEEILAGNPRLLVSVVVGPVSHHTHHQDRQGCKSGIDIVKR